MMKCYLDTKPLSGRYKQSFDVRWWFFSFQNDAWPCPLPQSLDTGVYTMLTPLPFGCKLGEQQETPQKMRERAGVRLRGASLLPPCVLASGHCACYAIPLDSVTTGFNTALCLESRPTSCCCQVLGASSARRTLVHLVVPNPSLNSSSSKLPRLFLPGLGPPPWFTERSTIQNFG